MPRIIDGPLVVVGNLHGASHLLDRLWRRLTAEVRDLDDRWVVFAGDTRPRWLHDRPDRILPPADCPQVVVSGHTKVPAVEVRHGGRMILVDTFGGYGSVLSAVLLPELTVVTSGG